MSENIKGAYRQDILLYVKEKFDTDPEFLWLKYPGYAVLRHADNSKWYAIIMDVPKDRLGLTGKDKVDILDIKSDPLMTGSLMSEDGILPGYHMKKGNWITILLDGTVDRKMVYALLNMSYELTKSKQAKRRERTEPKEWIVPANPKYYDVEEAFCKSDTILWKQSGNIIVGDTIFLYMAAPISAIIYQCEAVEVGIPYSYDSDELHMRRVMKIRLKHRFDKDKLTFKKLNEFGVYAVRGLRSIPHSLSCEIQRLLSENEDKE